MYHSKYAVNFYTPEYPNVVPQDCTPPNEWMTDAKCGNPTYPCNNCWCYRHGQHKRIERANKAHINPQEFHHKAYHITLRCDAYMIPEQAWVFIRRFIKHAKKNWKIRSYLWTAEFVEFIPHFHLVVVSDHYCILSSLKEAHQKALDALGHPNAKTQRMHVKEADPQTLNHLIDYIHKTHWKLRGRRLPPITSV